MVSKKSNLDETEIGDSTNLTRKRRKRCSNVEYCLPDDVIFIILLYFPADIIYNVMRLVCRQWYDLIQSPTFISLHFQNSFSNGFFIEDKINFRTGYYVKPKFGGGSVSVLEVKELKFPFSESICGSCNGIVFVLGPTECTSYLVNPLTKQCLPLPLFPGPFESRSSCCFAYVPASRVYKVIHYSYNESECIILTVGVDKAWRLVNISQLSSSARDLLESLIWSCLSSKGFLYWEGDSFILGFDVETEYFWQIPYPLPRQYNYHLLAMENSLCLCFSNIKNMYLFEFWLLKDPESGHGHKEWEKLPDIINLMGQWRLRSIRNIRPLGWLRNKDLFIFNTKLGIMVYDVNTGKVHQTKEMKNKCKASYYLRLTHVHVDTLVPLHNLSLDVHFKTHKFRREKVYLKENMNAVFGET